MLKRLCTYTLLTFLGIFWHPAVATQVELPAELTRALNDLKIVQDDVSIWVQRSDQDEPLIAHRADTPRNPASVMKLVTTYAALKQLGPAHQWHTTVLTDGAVENGVLKGHLFIQGSGDPALTQEQLWLLLNRIRARGVLHIQKGIVLDHEGLSLPPHDPGAFDGRPLRPYNAGPDALNINFNAVQIDIASSASAQRPPTLSLYPPLAGLTLENRLQASPGTCGLWYQGLEADVQPEVGGQGQRIIVSGNWKNDCGDRSWNLSPLAPNVFARALVSSLWQQVGGSIGQPTTEGLTPPDAQALLTHDSPSLGEVLRDMNKWSNNLMARQIFASIGQSAQITGEDAVTAARRYIPQLLREDGIDIRGLTLDNGSGLSRSARITARSLGELIRTALKQDWQPEFAAGLPIVGIDGTTHRRLTNSPLQGHARLKTGTLDGVSGIGGYLRDRSGQDWIVVMLTNSAGGGSARPAEDTLLNWVWQQAAQAR